MSTRQKWGKKTEGERVALLYQQLQPPMTGEMADKGRENDLPQISKNVLKVSSFRTVAAMMNSFIE